MKLESLSISGGRLKGWLRVGLALALVLQLGLGTWTGNVQAAEATAVDSGSKPNAATTSKKQVSDAVSSLQAALSKSEPMSDWVAFGLARSGQSVGIKYLPLAVKSVENGSLSKVTDYARVALAVNANGGDVRKVGAGKVDLLSKIVNFEKITAQGVNAPAYALLALDAGGYVPGTNDRWTRDDLIKWLVDQRNTDGGWSLAKGKSDVDVTAIVLTALAGYKDRKEVSASIDEALVWLSGVQRATAGFGSPVESSESSAQVLIALTSLGIDPINDSRFIKNEKSTVAALLEYRQPDGQFSHLASGKADGMATFNALLGLTAVERWMDGLPGLYSGVPIETKTSVTVYELTEKLTTSSANGKTALEALINVLGSADIPYKVDRHPQFGAMLQEIAGVENGKFGGYDGWQYAVKRNGAWVTIGEGMGSFALQAGDELSVYYGGADTTLIHGVKVEPAAPREGQSLTLTVEKEAFDWESGKVVVSPAENADVKIGGQIVKTDKDGKAEIKALEAGANQLIVDGYRSNAPLAYVAWTTSINIATYTKQVSVRIEGDAGVVASGPSQGGTALEAVEKLLKSGSIKHEIQDSTYGKYIDSIAGLKSGKFGGYDGWRFAVVRGGNWIIPAVGVGAFQLEEGDEVVVYYSGDTTLLIDPISVVPANPIPGEDFTITVTNRAWDWEASKFEAAKPISGVKVSVGTVSAVTNDKGEATLKGLAEGLYSLQVTGYAKDVAPTAVRSVLALPIVGSYQDQSKIAAWALDAVKISRAAPLLRGVNDGTAEFKPQQAVTRAEFVASLARALGLKGSASLAFKDIPSQAWYAKDVAAAVSAGLVNGVSATQFAPDVTLTREQAAILLTRALKLKATTSTSLVDAKQIAASAVSSVQAVIQQGWMTPYEGKFAPKATLSREQAAVIAVRVMKAKQ
ncbi:S-layer homology domain-containing protein [Cohnella sp. WQ 127256]|uniref:S-layer homology domain-containing protein n=1 Tax=Cohnella sp. WQ 127256 TaxID=2938790 RepID=UPI002118A09E|nr:S-layer homology domain-containing protein [Cohnella sp. WQ 127256]